MSGAWECRPYRPGDERGILDLYREVFRLDLTPEYWRWAFQNSPDGPAIIAVIEQSHRIVGHYEVTPKSFWIDGMRSSAGYAGGTMLAPQVRNVSTFVEMAKLAYQMCRERQFSWLYCCPNATALPIRTKLLQWQPLADIAEWEGPPPRTETRETQVHAWERWPDSLTFTEHAPAIRGAVRSQRSPAWVQWRYFDRPGGEYVLHTLDDGRQVAGFAVTKRYNRDGTMYGHIIDWQLPESHAAHAASLLNSAFSQMREWDAQRVSCWADGDIQLQQALLQAGLSPSGRKSHLCYYVLSGNDGSFLEHRAAWQIGMADCDVY
jgi:Acetyltransferase (GNAT) domain